MFDAKKESERIIKFIRDYYKKYNLGGVVLGISGGKDSGVVAGLFAKALGGENVIGITMPCHSRSEDKTDAKLVSDYYGFRLYDFDLTETFDVFKKQITDKFEVDEQTTINSDINLKPRLRMSTLYYFAAMFTAMENKGYLVAGTSNKCELYVGYFTKGGDSVHDISVLADLSVDQVIQIGEVIGVPEKVLYKRPDDGLSNLSDEDKLGVKYSEIASYMAGEKVSDEATKRIEYLHRTNSHKFNIPTFKLEEE